MKGTCMPQLKQGCQRAMCDKLYLYTLSHLTSAQSSDFQQNCPKYTELKRHPLQQMGLENWLYTWISISHLVQKPTPNTLKTLKL